MCRCSNHLDGVKSSLQPSGSFRRWPLWRGSVRFLYPPLVHAILRSWCAALILVNRLVSHINGTLTSLLVLRLSFSLKIPKEMKLGVELWAKFLPYVQRGIFTNTNARWLWELAATHLAWPALLPPPPHLLVHPSFPQPALCKFLCRR